MEGFSKYEERRELKRKLYRVATNVNILGNTFLCFACLAFGELKLMGFFQDHLLIARDENQHLALTQNIINKWKQGMILRW